MAGFYREGERRQRPGVYLRIENIGADSSNPTYTQVAPTPTPTPPPDESRGIMVTYDGYGLVTLSIPGCTVTHDGNGTVTLSGIGAPVTYSSAGNVTIGGRTWQNL